MSTLEEKQVVVAVPTKSMGLAILLTVLFGPLGMLYSTVLGACIMFVLELIVGIFTAGLGLFFLWPIPIIWAAIAVNSYNKRLVSGR